MRKVLRYDIFSLFLQKNKERQPFFFVDFFVVRQNFGKTNKKQQKLKNVF